MGGQYDVIVESEARVVETVLTRISRAGSPIAGEEIVIAGQVYVVDRVSHEEIDGPASEPPHTVPRVYVYRSAASRLPNRDPRPGRTADGHPRSGPARAGNVVPFPTPPPRSPVPGSSEELATVAARIAALRTARSRVPSLDSVAEAERPHVRELGRRLEEERSQAEADYALLLQGRPALPGKDQP